MKQSMKTDIINDRLIQETISFHGHWCPGLATGIRAAEWAIAEFGKASDEEIVAVVETDMCGVDAIQYLTGCTFGKGNLIHKDYGKSAFSFYRRRDGKSARLVGRNDIREEFRSILDPLHAIMQEQGLSDEEAGLLKDTREKVSARIMNSPIEHIFDVRETNFPVPRKAGIMTSLVCAQCGESVMETRTRRFHDRTLCIPCFDVLETRL
jgi:formylmethanofuran dehydrogenase subunit E